MFLRQSVVHKLFKFRLMAAFVLSLTQVTSGRDKIKVSAKRLDANLCPVPHRHNRGDFPGALTNKRLWTWSAPILSMLETTGPSITALMRAPSMVSRGRIRVFITCKRRNGTRCKGATVTTVQ